MPWLCTTIAGSMPILAASWSAAPSAFGPGGTGRVNDVCTMPSPVVSPYGRTTEAALSSGRITVPSGTGHLRGVQDLQRRVVGVRPQRDDAIQALAAVGRPLGDAEGAVRDRGDQALGMVGDPPEQVHCLAQHRVGTAVDEAALGWVEVLGQSARGV